MYIEAEICTSTDSRLSLPSETIVNLEEKYFVLIKKDNQTLEKREVTIGKTTNGFVEILNHTEFNKDIQFLTKGAFNLITN